MNHEKSELESVNEGHVTLDERLPVFSQTHKKAVAFFEMEKLILKFELDRKQMISANDRLHFQKKAKITKFLRQLAHYEGRNTLLDYFGLPFSEKKPCRVIVWVFAPTNRIYDPPNWSPTSKALLDGLTDAKFWTDDNYHVIKSTDFRHGGKSGNKKYRIELEIIEWKETSE